MPELKVQPNSIHPRLIGHSTVHRPTSRADGVMVSAQHNERDNHRLTVSYRRDDAKGKTGSRGNDWLIGSACQSLMLPNIPCLTGIHTERR